MFALIPSLSYTSCVIFGSFLNIQASMGSFHYMDGCQLNQTSLVDPGRNNCIKFICSTNVVTGHLKLQQHYRGNLYLSLLHKGHLQLQMRKKS